MVAKKAPPKGRFYRKNHGRNHSYYLKQDDGTEVKLDGVTTILSNGVPKPALINWASNTTAEEAVNRWDELSKMPVADRLKELQGAKNRQRDAAGKRGTEVHNLADKLAHGEEVEVPDEIRGHVEQAVAFLDEFEVEIILTETPCFHERALYGGTFDLVIRSAKYPGKVILADWKTTRSGIFAETNLQLTAYRRATHYLGPDGKDLPMADLGITDTWAVWVKSDTYEVYDMASGAEQWQSFANAAGVARSISDKEVTEAWKSAPLRPGVSA